MNYQVNGEGPNEQYIMAESKGNPLIGVFRHSPSIPSKCLGLKSILYKNQAKSSTGICSQLQVSREAKKFPAHLFLKSLKQIPKGVYSASSVGSKSEASPDQPQGLNDENIPTCSICLMPYADGDELRTFACSHCFHSECVSKYIFHRCLNNDELDSFNCPECRQNHITLSEAGSSRTSLAEGISNLSFLQVGQNLTRECGYDFLSDFGSDLQSPCPNSIPTSPRLKTTSAESGTSNPGIAISSSGSTSPILLKRVFSLEAPATTQLGSPGSGRLSKPPITTSPRRDGPLSSSNTFGARLHVLNKSSNRMLGIFPVPEDSYCLMSESGGADTGELSLSRSTSAEGLFGASALLAVSNMSNTDSTLSSSTPTAASRPALSPTTASALSHHTSVPPPVTASVPSWAAMDPLCASEYSDCGRPLPANQQRQQQG